MSLDRGQAMTLEAVVGALILLSSIVFALQMTAVTPLSASTSSQHIENQLEASAQGVLAASVEDGSLKRALLYYNTSDQRFNETRGDPFYQGEPPNIVFGNRTKWAFDDRGIAYDVTLRTGGRTVKMFDRGEPSDNAVTATKTVVLMDDDVIYDESPSSQTEAQATSTKLVDTDNFYVDDQSSGGLYAVVRVEVVVWRI